MSHLWSDPCSHRLFPSGFYERVEMEPARFCRSLRIVEKELSPPDRRYLVVIELDLPAVAPARFVLSSFQTLELGF